MAKIGRPEKYRVILNQLEPHRLYTPATIAQEALVLSDGGNETEKVQKQKYQRVRIAMGRKSNTWRFPDEGDGMVTLRGQAPCPGWFGWRWQKPREETPDKEKTS